MFIWRIPRGRFWYIMCRGLITTRGRKPRWHDFVTRAPCYTFRPIHNLAAAAAKDTKALIGQKMEINTNRIFGSDCNGPIGEMMDSIMGYWVFDLVDLSSIWTNLDWKQSRSWTSVSWSVHWIHSIGRDFGWNTMPLWTYAPYLGLLKHSNSTSLGWKMMLS